MHFCAHLERNSLNIYRSETCFEHKFQMQIINTSHIQYTFFCESYFFKQAAHDCYVRTSLFPSCKITLLVTSHIMIDVFRRFRGSSCCKKGFPVIVCEHVPDMWRLIPQICSISFSSCSSQLIFCNSMLNGARGSAVVKALCYKPEGHVFETR
jgi:hypothetical protein